MLLEAARRADGSSRMVPCLSRLCAARMDLPPWYVTKAFDDRQCAQSESDRKCDCRAGSRLYSTEDKCDIRARSRRGSRYVEFRSNDDGRLSGKDVAEHQGIPPLSAAILGVFTACLGGSRRLRLPPSHRPRCQPYQTSRSRYWATKRVAWSMSRARQQGKLRYLSDDEPRRQARPSTTHSACCRRSR
jgi:hypothetical protein